MTERTDPYASREHYSRSDVVNTYDEKRFGRMAFTQTLLNVRPALLATAINIVDQAFSRLIPAFGTWLYFLARKSPGRPGK